jgi:hypothetical protein
MGQRWKLSALHPETTPKSGKGVDRRSLRKRSEIDEKVLEDLLKSFF